MSPSHHNPQSQRIYDKDGLSPTIDVMGGGNRQPKIEIRDNTKKGYAEAEVGDGIDLAISGSKTRRGTVQKGLAKTLHSAGLNGTYDGTRIRRLTPRECERLQGFPDDWTEIGYNRHKEYLVDYPLDVYAESDHMEKISDSQRYKMAGNAVTTNTVEAVMTALRLHDEN